MSDKELWELMSIICEGQDSEQRRKVEQYITDLQKEIERLNNVLKEAREYIEENTKKGPIKDKRYFYSPEQANELLEILDKGE